MFKIFPGTFTQDGRKVPIAEMKDWKEKATDDQSIISQWSQLYAHKLKVWMVPTGSINDILVLDVDIKDNGYETLKKYDLPVTLSQVTRSGGKHFIFKYPQDGRVYGNRVKFDQGLDVRGEGGYIAYYGFDTTPIAEAPQWLLDVAVSEKHEQEPIDPSQLVKVNHALVQEILDEACENVRNAPQGESNNVLNVESYRVGQLLPSGSIDYQTAFNALFKAAKDRGKPDYEAKATIESGFKGGSSTPFTSPFGNLAPVLTIPDLSPQVILERWTPRFFTKYDLTNFSKLRKPQLFKDWSTEDIHITTADGGTGKTTLKLVEAICLALGEPFLGFECLNPGRTLFITGEDSYEKLGAMIGAILKQMGALEDDAKTRKVIDSILVKKDSDLRLVTKDKSGYINPCPDAFKKVMEAVEDLRPKMIVFDPIASFWGRESDLNDMTIAVAKFMGQLVEQSNACVEAINHMGKASSTSKDMSQFAGRGGTGLPSHARVSRVLRPVWDEEFEELTGQELGDRAAIMCNINKFSDGSSLYNKPFLIVRNGFLFERVVLMEQKVKEEVAKQSDTERIFSFIAEERSRGNYTSKSSIAYHFANQTQKISKERVTQALDHLVFIGHMGQKIKLIENPDVEQGGKVYIIEG